MLEDLRLIDMSDIGSIVGAGIGAYADYKINQQNNQFNAQQAAINRQFQTEEREAAQEWNYSMWQEQNEYNSPEQQYNRLIAAGMNPSTALQMLSQTGNTAGSVATTPQPGSVASAAGVAQPGSMIALAAKNAAETSLIKGETESVAIENLWKPKEKARILANLEAENKEIISRTNLNDKQAEQVEKLTPNLVKRSQLELRQLRISIRETKIKCDKLDAEIDVLKKEADKIEKESQAIEEERLKTIQERLSILEDTKYKQWRNCFIDDNHFDPNSPWLNAVIQLAGSDDTDTLDRMIENVSKSVTNVGRNTLDELPPSPGETILDYIQGMKSRREMNRYLRNMHNSIKKGGTIDSPNYK